MHDPEFREVAEELWKALASMIKVANMEEAAAEVGKQLVRINQVANSLEKSVIPSLEDSCEEGGGVGREQGAGGLHSGHEVERWLGWSSTPSCGHTGSSRGC
jgi:hypothetical protein